MQKKIISLAVSSLSDASFFAMRRVIVIGQEGTADFLHSRRVFGNEKPWSKRNRRKLGGIKGGAA